MKRLEQIRPAMLRLGTNAESAYMASRPFELTLEFPSLGAALAFRLDFYSTRKFLNHLRDRNKPEVMPFLSALSGLNRLSCARCDREPSLRSLHDYGYVPLHFRLSSAFEDNIDAQLNALGLDDIPTDLNVNTMRNADFQALATPSASASATPSLSPTGSMHTPSTPITLRKDPDAAITLFDQTFTKNDVTSASLHEKLLGLSTALLEHATSPSSVTQARIRMYRRKLLDGQISDDLRLHLLNNPSYDDIIAASPTDATPSASPTSPKNDL